MATRKRRGASVYTAEAVVMTLLVGLVFLGVFVGWIVGHYATPGHTKTVTVAAGSGKAVPPLVQLPAGAPPEVKRYAAEFPTPNGDLANTRATQGSIDSGNVEQLGIAWT